jgi:hypothetical protein
MTHDELLELIETSEEFYDDGLNATPAWSGLRSVVELHKPEYTRCIECESFYPCTTIQAIEKELA